MTSNFDKWNFVLKDLESPQLFIDFTWFWTIGSALQRRVYFGDYRYAPIFANPFIMFVADPGIGKSMAARLSASKILKTFKFLDKAKVANGFPQEKCWTDMITFSADDTTIQSLIQQLNRATRTFEYDLKDVESGITTKQRLQHASMSILLSEEMTSLFKPENEDMCAALNQWYDAQDYYRKTKTQGEENIKNVCVAFLGCTTPDNVKKLMRCGSLQQGFTARVWPIYVGSKRHRQDELYFTKEQDETLSQLQKHVAFLTQISGAVKFNNESKEWFRHYYMGDNPKDMTKKSPLELARINGDKRCDDYYGRIKVHIIKMAMLLHFSEFQQASFEITLPTLQTAIAHLQRIEVDMHKALASSGANPLFDFYKKVYDEISKREFMTKVQLKLFFGEDLDDLHLEQVIKYLGEVNKIKFTTNPPPKYKGKSGYVIVT